MLKYSAVVPVFNEESNLKLLYKRMKAMLEGLGSPYEIIYVDDASSDSSYSILRDIALSDGSVRVISFKRNLGQHMATAAGLLNAKGDYVMTMDADLQNPPEQIPRLLDVMGQGFDMVSGCRKMRKDSLSRRFCSYVTNLIISAIAGLKMRDYGSMLRVFKRETAHQLAEEFLKSGAYITMLLSRVTRNVAEVYVDHNQRYAGESKYTIKRLFSVFSKIFLYYRRRKILPDREVFDIAREIEHGKETINP